MQNLEQLVNEAIYAWNDEDNYQTCEDFEYDFTAYLINHLENKLKIAQFVEPVYVDSTTLVGDSEWHYQGIIVKYNKMLCQISWLMAAWDSSVDNCGIVQVEVQQKVNLYKEVN